MALPDISDTEIDPSSDDESSDDDATPIDVDMAEAQPVGQISERMQQRLNAMKIKLKKQMKRSLA
jgi:hypothetical protein